MYSKLYTYKSIFCFSPYFTAVFFVFDIKSCDLTAVVIPPTQLNVDVRRITPKPLGTGW